MRNTDKDWGLISTNEPYYGVLSNERFLKKNLGDDELKEFFLSGERDINHILGMLRSMDPDFSPKLALDFGCGVGRLLAPICKLVPEAYGIDIAENMLNLSQINLGNMGLSNFKLGLVIPDVAIDWVNSWIVFQHIPPIRGYEIIKKLWSLLNSGGALSIHFTIYRDQRHLAEIFRDVNTCMYNGVDINIFESNDEVHPGSMTMYDYDFSKILSILKLRDGQHFLAEHVDHGGCHGLRLYLIK